MYSSTLFLTSSLDEVGWSTLHPGRFTPGKDLVPIVLEAGWAPGQVWRGAENLAPTGIPSPDRPAHSSVAIPTELPRSLHAVSAKVVLHCSLLLSSLFTFIEQERKPKLLENFGLYHARLTSVPHINPLLTKPRLLYLKTQSVPRCKHFSSWL